VRPFRDRGHCPQPEWRERLLTGVFHGLVPFGLVAALLGSWNRVQEGQPAYIAVYVVAYATVVFAAFNRRLGYAARVFLLLALAYILAAVSLTGNGLASGGPIFLIVSVVLSSLLFGLRGGAAAVALGLAIYAGCWVSFAGGWLSWPPADAISRPERWFAQMLVFASMAAAAVISLSYLIRSLEGSLQKSATLVDALEERVAEQQRAEEALSKSEKRLLQAQRAGRIGSWEWNAQRGQLWWSDEMYRINGLDPETFTPSLGNLMRLIDAEDRDDVLRQLEASRSQDAFEVGCRIRRPDGSVRHIKAASRIERDDSGATLRVTGTAQDLTKARQLELQLLQSQKLEAVGQLAGGVAHDFNNLLTIITGYGEELLQELEGTAHDRVKHIHEAAERAASLTRQLLAFSRQQLLRPEVLELNRVVRDLNPMLRRLIDANIQVRLDLESGLERVDADAGQIGQILINLAVNARDAMPDGGELSIATCGRDFPSEYSETSAEAQPGPHVCLSVSDTGCGMDAETQKHIFEPFFTTKPAGQGTGLGLATVYGIVKQSGGEIRVRSVQGSGTSVEVYLPCTDKDEAGRPAPPPSLESGRSSTPATVLLAEDEPQLRALVRRWLTEDGHHVLQAGDGEEALRKASSHPGPIDLMLTDVVMPKMGGVELKRRLLERRPGIPVVFMSGYPDPDRAVQFSLPNNATILHKPFRLAEVRHIVREILDPARRLRSTARELQASRARG